MVVRIAAKQVRVQHVVKVSQEICICLWLSSICLKGYGISGDHHCRPALPPPSLPWTRRRSRPMLPSRRSQGCVGAAAMAGVAVRRRTRSASPRAHRVLRDGQELDVRRKKGDARYAHPIVDTPPSKPVTVVCEQPKPSKVTMPKKAEAASELLILFNTQAASTVLKVRSTTSLKSNKSRKTS